jgi:hypothetical protein
MKRSSAPVVRRIALNGFICVGVLLKCFSYGSFLLQWEDRSGMWDGMLGYHPW